MRVGWMIGIAMLVALPAPAQTYSSLGPLLLTPDGATIPRGGGVLFGYEETPKDDLGKEPTVQKRWRFRRGRATSKPRIETLAPGLSVYRPRAHGEVVLLDGDGEVRGTFTFERDGERFAAEAPALAYANRIQDLDDDRDDWAVDFAEPLPDDAFAVILYAVHGKRRTAINWYRIDGEASSSPLVPPGMRLPEVDEKVEVRWVDVYGRRSPASKVVKVGEAMQCTPGRHGCPGDESTVYAP